MDNGLGHGQIESFSYEMFPLNFRLTTGVQLKVLGRVATQCPRAPLLVVMVCLSGDEAEGRIKIPGAPPQPPGSLLQTCVAICWPLTRTMCVY